MNKSFLEEKFKDRNMTHKQQVRYILAYGDIDVVESILSDQRKRIVESEKPGERSNFTKNNIKYMDTNYQTSSDEDPLRPKMPTWYKK